MYSIAANAEFTEYQLNLVGFQAAQSSYYSDISGPEKAIDGNGNPHYHDGESCTHTPNEKMAWWSVDMTKEQSITKVEVVNRGDCCGKSKYLVTSLCFHFQYIQAFKIATDFR